MPTVVAGGGKVNQKYNVIETKVISKKQGLTGKEVDR